VDQSVASVGGGDGPATLDYRPARTSVPPCAAAPVLGWGLVILPPLVAVVCWPILFVIFFVLSFTIALMTTTACLFWAWSVSERVSAWRYWTRVLAVERGGRTQPSPGHRARLKALLFAFQAVIIFSSCPLFELFLQLARRNGVRIVWWL
jgi:hypothetical protein